MFQSSRMASGNLRRQASSACYPSSASSMVNSRPSRMRRATFRMTLESSTTKQVFMSCLVSGSCQCSGSRGCGAGVDGEHAVDIEDQQELLFETVDSGRHR